MSIHERRAEIATESVESPEKPRVADSQNDYAELVAALVEQLDIDAAEAKEHISEVGRDAAAAEAYIAQRFTSGVEK